MDLHDCAYCGRTLKPTGPSLDFCGPSCQHAWTSGHTSPPMPRACLCPLCLSNGPMPDHDDRVNGRDDPGGIPADPITAEVAGSAVRSGAGGWYARLTDQWSSALDAVRRR